MDLDRLDDETYNAEMKALFRTPGWEIFIAEMWDNVHNIDDVQNITSAEDLFFRKGQLSALALIINFEDTIKRSEEEAQEEAADESA